MSKTSNAPVADIYFQQAKDRFKSYANVELLHGDSGSLMPLVLSKLTTPALFWLDGHYSGGLTEQVECDTPVSAELQEILTSQCKSRVILVDDIR